jgi:hypothetical protein
MMTIVNKALVRGWKIKIDHSPAGAKAGVSRTSQFSHHHSGNCSVDVGVVEHCVKLHFHQDSKGFA